MSSINDIKKAIEEKKAIVGTERVIKMIKKGELIKVYLSVNCPAEVKESIEYYAKLSKTEVIKLKVPNDELGTLCKKPYSISVLGIVKSES